jgi:YgiT-type zinc finger domain-containing protein
MREGRRTVTCGFCKGEMEERLIRYMWDFEGRAVIIENVPEEVCTQCGEKVFRPDIVEKLQRIAWGEPPETKTVRVPFYDFAEVG